MANGFLGGLGSFAGGLASGLQAGVGLVQQRQQQQMQQQLTLGRLFLQSQQLGLSKLTALNSAIETFTKLEENFGLQAAAVFGKQTFGQLGFDEDGTLLNAVKGMDSTQRQALQSSLNAMFANDPIAQSVAGFALQNPQTRRQFSKNFLGGVESIGKISQQLRQSQAFNTLMGQMGIDVGQSAAGAQPFQAPAQQPRQFQPEIPADLTPTRQVPQFPPPGRAAEFQSRPGEPPVAAIPPETTQAVPRAATTAAPTALSGLEQRIIGLSKQIDARKQGGRRQQVLGKLAGVDIPGGVSTEALETQRDLAIKRFEDQLKRSGLETQVVPTRDAEGNEVDILIDKRTGRTIRELGRGPSKVEQTQIQISAGERQKIAELRSQVNLAAGTINSLNAFAPGTEPIGPASGRILLGRKAIGATSAEEDALLSDLAAMRNVVLNLRSGATVVADEASRLAEEIPVVTDKPRTFRIKASKFIRRVNQFLGEISRGLRPYKPGSIELTAEEIDKLTADPALFTLPQEQGGLGQEPAGSAEEILRGELKRLGK